jgi:hypothetical protein
VWKERLVVTDVGRRLGLEHAKELPDWETRNGKIQEVREKRTKVDANKKKQK